MAGCRQSSLPLTPSLSGDTQGCAPEPCAHVERMRAEEYTPVPSLAVKLAIPGNFSPARVTDEAHALAQVVGTVLGFAREHRLRNMPCGA